MEAPMLDSVTDLASLLKDPSLLVSKAYVAGQWIDAADGATFAVTNPARGDVIARVPDLTRADAARAIEAADIARHEWAARTGKERAAILRKWADLCMANQDDLGAILTAEMGKPLAEAKGEIAYGAGYIEWFGEEAKRIYGETIPGHQRDKRITVIKQPIGVAASITPWNFPNGMIARKVAPALAAGCGFVARPAAETPLSALALAVLAERAGVPPGVFSVITSKRSSDIGKEFCENPRIRKLTFTGSTEVGRILLRQAADQVLKCSMELGGNAPFIVFDDADLDAAVDGAIASKYRNAGQTCVCANRIFVQSAVYDAFLEKFTAAVQKQKVGPGTEQGVSIGPLINAEALEKVTRLVGDATQKGARLLSGGHAMQGTFYEPTVLADVDARMDIMHEEIFGPVASVIRFDTEAEVVTLANDTPYGLAAYFYGRDIGRVFRVSEALDYGMIGVNTGLVATTVAPFGGMKESGIGREGSKYGLEEFLEVKYVCLGV